MQTVNTKVDKKFIDFLKREADKKKQRHEDYVEQFKKKELVKK